MIDLDNDGSLQSYEWTSFFKLFIVNFEGCDKDKNHRLDINEFKDCLNNETIFGNTMKYNDNLIPDKEVFTNQLFKMLDFRENSSINLYEYIVLRRTNYAYNMCLKQDGEFNYKNFPIAIHLTVKTMYVKITIYIRSNLLITRLESVYNHTVKYSFFEKENKMDFVTFIAISNLIRLFTKDDFFNFGYQCRLFGSIYHCHH